MRERCGREGGGNVGFFDVECAAGSAIIEEWLEDWVEGSLRLLKLLSGGRRGFSFGFLRRCGGREHK